MDDKQHTSSSDDERAEIATSNQDQETNSSKRVHLKTLAIHININWYNPNNSCHHSCCIYFYKSKNKWFKQN